MKNLFTSDFFSGNRHILRQKCNNDYPIVLSAHGQVQRSGDVAFPFRQDSNFWYITGLEIPELIVVLDAKEDFIILPDRDAILDVFEGAIDRQAIQNISGIEAIYGQHEGWEKLRALAKKYGNINVALHNNYDSHHNLFINPAKPRLLRWLKELDVEIIDIRMHFVHMRMIKQAPEITAIQHAVDITVDSLQKIFTKQWPNQYKNEREIDAQLSYEFALQGGKVAYPSIVAEGKNACTLHYVANNQSIKNDNVLLVDAGAEFENYAADITRVFVPNKMNQRQTSVYNAVREVQLLAVEMIKPGVNIKKIQQIVSKHIGRYLKAEKLINNLNEGQIMRYFPHAVSHHLGLDVHDVADYSVPLAEGMVITIEPGIYVPEWSVGIRIEDDILVTKDGAQILSDRLPS